MGASDRGPFIVDQAFLDEHERLARRSRELHSLHALGRGLDTVTDPDRVLALVGEAARSIAAVARVEVVAQVDSHERPWWSAPAAPPFTVEVRQAVEAVLGEKRARPASAFPAVLPERVLPFAIEHGGALFGWVFLVEPPPLSGDTRDLLEVLAGQAATTLHNLELLQDRIRSDRLSTVGRMISTIVHDFRNPMTSIRGHAAMIEEMDIGPARRKECARLVLEETERMSAMIDEILEFTSGGTPRLRRKRIAVEDLVARLKRLVDRDLGERGVTFRADLAFRGIVIADADRMVRALLNIAANAVDAMPSGGTLTVRSRVRGEHVELDVQDTGHGIAPELLPRVFEPFFTHGKPRGIGLGMAITRKIVEDHGGSIDLTSRVGEGTCFTVALPAEAPLLRPSAARGAYPVPPR
jgi:signal transduction histidine kinase